jgi:hypothetical protein
MILSDLVRDDQGGFVNLDRNLGKHIGAENVEAFHTEAGDLVVDAMTDDPELFEILMKDRAVVKELQVALAAVEGRAQGRSTSDARLVAAAGVDSVRANVAAGGVARSLVHAELLTNGVINDRTMRNPKVMAILDKRVRELFNRRRKNR